MEKTPPSSHVKPLEKADISPGDTQSAEVLPAGTGTATDGPGRRPGNSHLANLPSPCHAPDSSLSPIEFNGGWSQHCRHSSAPNLHSPASANSPTPANSPRGGPATVSAASHGGVLAGGLLRIRSHLPPCPRVSPSPHCGSAQTCAGSISGTSPGCSVIRPGEGARVPLAPWLPNLSSSRA